MSNKPKQKNIPDGWCNKILDNACEVKGGYAFKSLLMSSEPASYQVVKMGNIYNNTLDLKRTTSYISHFCEKEYAYLLKKGDILVSLTGTIGKRDYGYVVQIKEEKNLLVNQRLALLRTKKMIFQKFLFNKVKHKLFQDCFFDISKGGTGNQSNVSISALKQILLLLPPIEEQKRIVAVLETWDKYLEKLERKIVLKRNIKKGLMQQLLTEKRRVEGFSGEWQVVKLGDICEIRKGRSFTKKELVCGHIPVIAGGQSPAYFHNQSNREGLTITVSASGAYAGFVDFYKKPIFASDCSTIQKKEADIKFIYLVMKHKQKFIYHDMQVGGAQPHVYPKDLEKMKMMVPKSKKEQSAIAKILTKSDEEIEALEQKKKVVEAQKKYLLNNLITGKIRTV